MAEKARIDAAGRTQQAERLAVRVQQLKRRTRRVPARPSARSRRAAPASSGRPLCPRGSAAPSGGPMGTPSDLLAGREVWVELTPGMDAGLRQGAILSVQRINGAGGKYLGTITVDRVNAKDAVGRFTPANPRAVGADDLPKPGDQLAASTSNR